MPATRTALYYPKIVIPNKQWIRQAILYWDDIGSIVPREIWDSDPFFESEDQDIYQLHEAGLYRPFHPENLTSMRSGLQAEFEDEFFRRLDHFEEKFQFTKNINYTQIFNSKEIKYGIFENLKKRGLTNRKNARYELNPGFNHPFTLLEENTSNLYMGLLAEYFAKTDRKITIPMTDQGISQDLVFLGTGKWNRQISAQIVFNKVLPVPKNDVSIDKIIDFKEDYKGELIHLRRNFDKFQSEISSMTSFEEIRDYSNQFLEQMEKGVIDLKSVMEEKKIETVLGSISAIVHAKEPEWIGALIAAGVVGHGIGELNQYRLAGLMCAATISVGLYLMKQNTKRNEILRDSPYSYLYHAEQQFT